MPHDPPVAGYVHTPTGSDICTFLSRENDARLQEQADTHVGVMTELVKSYTRGRGFSVDGMVAPDIYGVIVLATARLITNPSQAEREDADGYSATGGFTGYSLAELGALHAHRRRTA